MPSPNFIRCQPGAGGAVKSGGSGTGTPTSPPPSAGEPPRGPSPQASLALSQLEALRTNKAYASLRELVVYAGEFTANPQHCISDAPVLLKHLVKNLYKNRTFLGLLFHS